jgi:rod shape-determining protein MreC
MSRSNVIALIVFGSLLVWVFSFDADTTQGIQRKVLSFISPFQRAGTEIENGLSSLGEEVPQDPRALIQENERLRQEVAKLRVYRSELVKLREEYNEITRLLELKEMSHLSLISARVIGRDSTMWWRTVTIDKGSRDRIAVESPILNDRGLIGKTHVVGSAASTVLLLTDEQCKVSVRVEGTNEKGIVQGMRGTPSGEPLLKLLYLSKYAKIEKGARVFTSGVGGLFPPGLPIGEVKDFRVPDHGVNSEATVVPAADFSQLKFVFVMERAYSEEVEEAGADDQN